MFHLLHRGLAEQVLAVVLIFGLLVRVYVGVWGFVLFLFGFLDLVRTNCLIRTAVVPLVLNHDERSTGAKKNTFYPEGGFFGPLGSKTTSREKQLSDVCPDVD